MIHWRQIPALAVQLVALLIALGSCITGGIHLYTCDDPCGNGEPGYTCDDPCSDAERCPGECVPIAVLGWDGPALLWFGEELSVPECPPRASQIVYEGRGDLDDSNQCGCACGPAACVLPSGLLGSDQTTCPNDEPGATVTPIDAPAGWDGSCVAQTTTPGAVIESITFASPTLRACEPVKAPVPTKNLGSPWKTFARACRPTEPLTACTDTTKICAPTSGPPPEGFSQCILSLREEDVSCPANYPAKHVFYQSFQDDRSCGPCDCGPPTGGLCSTEVTAYSDEGCATELDATSIQPEVAGCRELPSPGVLGGMTATFTTKVPGSCAPSAGSPMGAATPIGRSIFCCRSGDME